jgi:hypothetical protein
MKASTKAMAVPVWMGGFSRPVMVGSTAAAWPASPISRCTAAGSLDTSKPRTLSSPPEGGTRAATVRMKVVFPAPSGPRTAST